MDNESLAMEQTEEVVTPQDAEEEQQDQAQEAEGEQSSEDADRGGRAGQSREDNRIARSARLSGEQAGYARAMQEVNDRIARSGMRNPSSGAAITDLKGLEEFSAGFRREQIKQRAQKEGRPEAEIEEEEANREYVTRSRKQSEAQDAKNREAARQQEWIRNDARNFAQQYPDVDIRELEGNKGFIRFCGSRYGKEPLADLYEAYLEITGDAERAASARADSKAARATGAGGGGGSETLTASQQKALDEWNRTYPNMKMTAKEFLSR